jgi:hypothetical protein
MIVLKKKYFTYSRLRPDIHLVQVNDIEPTDDVFQEYIQFCIESTRELKGAVIQDISKAKFLSSQQRIKLSHVIKVNSELIKQNWTSIAYVNTSLVASIILKGVLLATPLPVKHKVFTDLDPAVKWCESNF